MSEEIANASSDDELEGTIADGSQVIRNASFGAAVDMFLNANAWVTDDHLPYVTALFKIATALDFGSKALTAALVMEYRQNFKELAACRPPADAEPGAGGAGASGDAFDAAIAKLMAGPE